MWFSSTPLVLVLDAIIGNTGTHAVKFLKKRTVFNVQLLTQRTLPFDAVHGFEVSGDTEDLCEQGAETAGTYFDKNESVGICHPYTVTFNEDKWEKTEDMNLVPCPGSNDTKHYIRKITKETDEYKVCVLKNLIRKVGALHASEGDRPCGEETYAGPSYS